MPDDKDINYNLGLILAAERAVSMYEDFIEVQKLRQLAGAGEFMHHINTLWYERSQLTMHIHKARDQNNYPKKDKQND